MKRVPPSRTVTTAPPAVSAACRGRRGVFCLLLALLLAGGCASTPDRREAPRPQAPSGHPKPYKVLGKWYQPLPHARGFRQRGIASWYGRKFHGRRTSNGETYDMYDLTAAHKTLPFGTYIRVKNLNNNRNLDVRINDRGPFVKGRIVDLSYTAARRLGVVGPGTAPVEIVALGAAADRDEQGRPLRYVPVDYYSGNFTFQIGAFTRRENALRLKRKLDPFYKNVHITVFDRGDQVFHRVRVGKCTSLEKADEYEAMLIAQGFSDVFTVAE